MDEQLQEDWLDARLRDESSYIDDAGFTAQVMQQLPPRRRHSASLRALILCGVTLVACIIAYFVTGRGAVLANAAEFLVAMPFVTVCAIAGSCAFFVMVLGLSLVFAREREIAPLREFVRGL